MLRANKRLEKINGARVWPLGKNLKGYFDSTASPSSAPRLSAWHLSKVSRHVGDGPGVL